MKKVLAVVLGISAAVVWLAGPAVADYPPSPSPSESASSPTPSVAGSETHAPSPSESVLGETVTVSPGVAGTAFTGSDLVGPLALGGILLVVGLALLYATRRRATAGDR
jgi:hypothetical protein